MKKIKLAIDWRYGLMNDPIIKIEEGLEYPRLEKFFFEKKGRFYYAQANGFVKFFHKSDNEEGFGGNIFKLKMKGGGIENIKGPWSSNTRAIEAAGFPPAVEIIINGVIAHVTPEKIMGYLPRNVKLCRLGGYIVPLYVKQRNIIGKPNDERWLQKLMGMGYKPPTFYKEEK